MRAFIGAILGIIVGIAVAAGVRFLAILSHPLPGMAINDPQAMTGWVQGAPLYTLILFAGAWAIAAWAGGWIAARIARWGGAAWIVTGAMLLLSASTMLQLGYPLWMKLVLIAGPLLGGWLAIRLRSARADDPIAG